MQIISPQDYVAMPWRDGGGVTHEVYKDDTPFSWRLSLADVVADGPFSHFAGLARVLTVIEGAGMVLHTPDGPLAADTFVPVSFSGETPVRATLNAGPIRDYNLIYNPQRWRALVSVQRGGTIASGADQLAMYSLETHAFGPFIPASTALLQGGTITLPEGFCALVIRLTRAF